MANSTSFGRRFVRSIVRRPALYLIAALVILGTVGPGGQYLLPDFSYRVWFNDDDPLLVEFDEFEKRFGNDEAAMVLVQSPSGIFDVDSAQLLFELTADLWKVHSVIRVDSLANYNWVHAEDDDMLVEPILPDLELEPLMGKNLAEVDQSTLDEIQSILDERREVALNHETLPGYLVSKDGKTAVLLASLKPAIEGSNDYVSVVEGIRAVFDKYRGRTDHILHQVGAPAVSNSFKEASQKDFETLFPIVVGLAILFLIVAFRRVSGVVYPLVIAIFSIIACMACGGWLGYSINNLTVIVPQIALAIAIADSVHILSTYYRSLRRGASRAEAAEYALYKNLLPTILTSVSTAIGFFSFSQANVVPIAMLGTLAGLGTLFAWVFTYFVLGPLMALVPVRVKVTADDEALDATTERGRRAAAWIERWRPHIIGGSAIITIGGVVLAAGAEVNSDPFEYFPPDSEINQARLLIEKNVGGAIPTEIVVNSGVAEGFKDPEFLAKVDEFQTWLLQKDFVTNVVSIVDILKSTNRSLHGEDPAEYKLPDTRRGVAEQFLLYTMSLPQGMDINDRVSLANDAIRISTNWNIHNSKQIIAEIEQLKRDAKERFGLDVVITGKTQLWQRMNPSVVNSFVVSITVAVILMSLLMIAVFRSVGLGLLAMIPNTVPLIVGGGLLVLLGKDLDIGTVIVFSVCLGIAVDDTVHFLANFNFLRSKGLNSKDAIANIFSNTMPALVITTVILVSAFGIFVFASFIPNRNFGFMAAFILSVALAADALLLPALLIPRGTTR